MIGIGAAVTRLSLPHPRKSPVFHVYWWAV